MTPNILQFFFDFLCTFSEFNPKLFLPPPPPIYKPLPSVDQPNQIIYGPRGFTSRGWGIYITMFVDIFLDLDLKLVFEFVEFLFAFFSVFWHSFPCFGGSRPPEFSPISWTERHNPHTRLRTALMPKSFCRGWQAIGEVGVPRLAPNADLRRASLARAALAGVVLLGAQLQHCSLASVDLRGRDFAGGDLSGANLSWPSRSFAPLRAGWLITRGHSHDCAFAADGRFHVKSNEQQSNQAFS